MKKCYHRLAGIALLTLSLPVGAWAQDIRGMVVDSKTQEPLVGATVQVKGTSLGVATDIDGKFHFEGLDKSKSYTLVIQYVSYKTKNIDGVRAKADGAEDDLRITLAADEQQLGDVTVTAVKRLNTDAAMIDAARTSSVIVSNVSAQEIKRSQDSNAGEVIRRIPGVSLVEGKFVMVRGLSQRYNNVWINGGAAPSSEADSRAFSFDMIPSGQIDNMMIVKTPTAEYPADYTGGFILINTKEIPTSNSLHLTLGGSCNTQTAFRTFLSPKSSPTDFLGFDSGMRSLSGGMDVKLSTLGTNGGGNPMIDLLHNGLNNDWRVRQYTPWADLKLAADWSRSWSLDGAKLGLIGAFNYSNEYRTICGMVNNFYAAYDTDNDRINPLRLSTDDQYTHSARLGAMLNLTLLSPNGKNKYQMKNIFNQLGYSRYTLRQGVSAQSEPERSAEYYYQSRTTYTGQLTGRHTFGGDALDWSVGYAYANRRLPDRRKYILYCEDPSQGDQYQWLYQNDISREWTSLDEHILSFQLNDTHRFDFESWSPSLKGGAYGECRTRKYKTRNLFYWYDHEGCQLPEGFRSMDMTALLSDETYFGANKLYLLEDVNKLNDYSGNNLLGAAYIEAELPLGKFEAHAGLRYEYNRMELISNTKSAVESHESHYYRQGDWFPSLNVTYHLLPEHQLRVSYGRSVNRPEFREVSPSVYYDFDLASDVQGNFDLRNCYVDNLDLRYEWYPSRGEVISLAAFWKHFDSPIEWVYTLSGGTDVIYSYMNARSANNYGLELDIRKQLDFIGLKDFSWSFNGALIHSRVRFAPGSNEYDRPMQGQSPYLVNTGIFYYNEPLQLSVNLLYNRIGKRIVGVGRTTGGGDASRNIRVPDSYEMPRDVFDLTASKRFGPLEIKLAIRDLLNQQITFKQFSDVMVQGEGRRIEQVTRCYRPGMNLNFSATLTL